MRHATKREIEMKTKKINSVDEPKDRVVRAMFECHKTSVNRYHVKVQYHDGFEWCGFVSENRAKEMVHEEAAYQDNLK